MKVQKNLTWLLKERLPTAYLKDEKKKFFESDCSKSYMKNWVRSQCVGFEVEELKYYPKASCSSKIKDRIYKAWFKEVFNL